MVEAEGATVAGLRFVALPPPTTADVEALTVTVAQRLTDRLAADAEERGEYLDPDLAALVSYPRSHSVRRRGVFANRSRFPALLHPPRGAAPQVR